MDNIQILVFMDDVQSEENRELILQQFDAIDDKITYEMLQLSDVDLNSDTRVQGSDFILLFSDHLLLQITRYAKYLPPLVTIELPGHHSFFAEMTLRHMQSLLNRLINQQYWIDERSLLTTEIDGIIESGLNDFYLSSTESNTRIRYELQLDGVDLFEDNDIANGILVSSPTGSTAMAMNLGGALIHPTSKVFQVQAEASRRNLTSHQIIPDTKILHISIQDAILPLLIQVDGRRYQTRQTNFQLKKAGHVIKLIRVEKPESGIQTKLDQKSRFEGIASLTSSSKFIFHVLQQQDRALKIQEIVGITQITNLKTIRSALKLLQEKGYILRKENWEDMREYLYYVSDPDLDRFYG